MKKGKVMKLFAMVAAASMLTGSLAGCGSSSKDEPDKAAESTDSDDAKETSEPEASDTETAEPAATDVYAMTKADLEGKTITLTSAEDWWNDTYQGVIDKYSEQFGVTVEVNILPAQTASEVIKSQFATGELADITMNSASPSELTYMRADEMLVNLNDEPWVEKISDTSGFLYTDGNLYGLPLASQDYWGFCANKKVLEECGLTVPTSKEELIECFKVLKEKGKIPFYSGAGDAWMCGNLTSSGLYPDMQKDPELVNKFNTNKMKYADSESFQAMLQDIYDWAKAGYFGDNFMSQTWDGMQEAVAKDEAGFSVGLTSWLTTMDTTYGAGTSDKLELIPYYIGQNDTVYQSTCQELYINKKSENIDIVRHLFNWLTQDENLQQLYDGLGSASIFKGVVSSGMCDSTKKLMDAIADGTYGMHVAHNAVIQGQDWDALCSMMQELFMGDASPEDFSAQYDEFRDSICKSLGLEGF